MSKSADPNERSEKSKDKAAEIKGTATEAADKAYRGAKAAWDKTKSKINDLEPLKAYVREKPVQAAAITFGIGFVAALLCRK